MKTQIFLIIIAFLLLDIFQAQNTVKSNQQLYGRLLEVRDIAFENDAKGQRILDSIKPVLEKKSVDSLWGLFYRTQAYLASLRQDKQKAHTFLDQSIQYYQKAKNPRGVALSIMNKGNVFLHQGNNEKALSTYFEGLSIAEKNKLMLEQGLINKNIGVFFEKIQKYDESLQYANKALSIFKKIGKQNEVLTSEMNIANVYYGKNDFDKAIAIYKNVHREAVKIEDDETIAKVYNNIAAVYIEGKSDFKNGITYLLKSLEIKEKIGDANDLMFQYNNIASAFLMTKDYLSSEKYAKKAYDLAIKDDNQTELREVYLTLSDLYSEKGDYKKALAYQKLYTETKDALLNEDNQKVIQELKTQYETAEKDHQIVVQKSKLLKRNTIIGLLSGLLLLGFLYYRNFQNKQKVAHQKEILKQQDLAAKAVILTEDRERKRMATHLHDGIGQSLSVINMNISVLDDYRENTTQFETILSKTKTILDDAIHDVRTLSHTIMPNMLIKHSLSDALRDLIEKSNSPKLHVDLKMEGLEDTIDPNIQVVVYRVIQECIQNTIKHAEATLVSIALVQDQNTITVTISDNGKGFDPLQLKSKSESVGLENMKSRIDFLKGIIKVSSAPKEGTIINVKIPLI